MVFVCIKFNRIPNMLKKNFFWAFNSTTPTTLLRFEMVSNAKKIALERKNILVTSLKIIRSYMHMYAICDDIQEVF